MNAEERHERLQRCLEDLREANHDAPILVEGTRDVRALRELGLAGEIRVYNAGEPLHAVADRLVRAHRRLIVLFDWDRTGGHLVRRLQEHLAAQADLDLEFRKEFALVSQVKCVEDLPAAVRLWSRRAAATSGRKDSREA